MHLGLLGKIKFREHVLPIAGGQLVTVVAGVFGVKILSHLVPPAVNGVYLVHFLTLAQLGVLLTHPGLINHACRYWQREKARSGSYARFLWQRSMHQLIPLTVILAGGCVALGVSQRDTTWAWAFPLLFVCNWALALNATATVASNADRRHWVLLALTSTGAVARVLLPTALVLIFSPSFGALACGFTLHALVLCGCVVALFYPAGKAAPAKAEVEAQWLRELSDYGRPFLWLGVGGWLLQFADRWIVSLFFGNEQAGLFALAASLGAFVPNLAQAALMQGVFPGVFRLADEARSEADWRAIARRCDQFTLLFLGVAVVGLLGLHWLAPHLLGVLIDQRYARSVGMVFAAGLAAVTVQVNQFHYMLLQGQHNSAGMVKVMLVVAGIKTAGSILAAMISWQAFLIWLVLSAPIAGWVGRHLIHRAAFLPEIAAKAD